MALGDVEAKEVEEFFFGQGRWQCQNNVETLLLDQTGSFRRPVAIRIRANMRSTVLHIIHQRDLALDS